MHPSLSLVSPVVKGGWVLERGGWGVGLGGDHLKRQPEGTGVRSSTTRKICRKSPGHHRSKVSLLSGTQGVGSPWQPLSPPISSLVSRSTGRDSHLSRLTCPSSQGLLHRLRGPECRPSQTLLGNQPGQPCLRWESPMLMGAEC